MQKPAKEIRNHPPTEEERAALRLRKEQEKLAKTLAKNASDNLSPIEVQKGDHHATAPGPDGRGSKSVVSFSPGSVTAEQAIDSMVRSTILTCPG